MSKFSCVKFHLSFAWNTHRFVFFSQFYFLAITVLLILTLYVMFRVAVISLCFLFLCSLLVDVSEYLEGWRMLFPLLFLTYIVCLRNLHIYSCIFIYLKMQNTKTLGKICITRKSWPFSWGISVCCFNYKFYPMFFVFCIFKHHSLT